MMPVVLLLSSLQTGVAEDGSPDLLRISLVIALVVASVVAVAFALRPLLPPARPPASDDEVDRQTLRSLGLAGETERPSLETTRRPAEVIPFPRGPRDLTPDESERLYRDPIVAARLRKLLDPDRRGTGRPLATPARPGGPRGPGQPAAPVRPWRVGEHDRRRVRHTEGEPARQRARDGRRDQEPTPMPPPDMEPFPGDIPLGPIGYRGPNHDEPPGVPDEGRLPEVIEGEPPSDADLDRLAAGGPQPRSKVVPFIPRQSPRESPPETAPVDQAVVEAITATVRELLFCANVGEYLHGFALYSDRYLFRFMDDTGLTVDEFREAFGDAPPRAPDEWTRLSRLNDVRRLDDGRVTALVSYVDGERPGGAERYTFEYSTSRGLWLIDDIQQV